METLLALPEMEVLHEICSAFDVRIDRWHLNPSIRTPFEVLATRRLAERIQDERGIGGDRALATAAGTLGLNPETVRSRWKRAS